MQTVGVDVGGTFTDISVVDEDGKLSILKVLSTPNDFSEAICSGIEQEIQTGNLVQNQVSSVVHAATVATNAIITRTGSKVGLITTEGFRDILEIGRLRYPRLYDMEWESLHLWFLVIYVERLKNVWITLVMWSRLLTKEALL